jgi:RNA polymerase sigma-70 factor (ECF subfamily)
VNSAINAPPGSVTVIDVPAVISERLDLDRRLPHVGLGRAHLQRERHAAGEARLQRARATLGQAHHPTTPTASRPASERERRVVEAFVRAWQACDIPALAALLRDDATLTMPPQALLIAGRDAVAGFFATVPAGGRLDLIRLAPSRANGHPAVAAYLPDENTDDCRGYGIMALTIDGDQIATITGFPDPNLFPIFDLPATR